MGAQRPWEGVGHLLDGSGFMQHINEECSCERLMEKKRNKGGFRRLS